MPDRSGDFLSRVPVLSVFSETLEPERYVSVPDDWVVGLADIVDSTSAIAAGRYKVVNTCGAAIIAGMSNALGGEPFPFAFAGDGANFLVGPDRSATASRTLSETAALARDELDLTLRTALVSVAACREAGHDLRLAYFRASPDLNYAMFSGGGLRWAETRMKAGEYLVEPAAAGHRPDLTGLSCRFAPVESRRGVILTLIVVPPQSGHATSFRETVQEILALIDASPDKAKPVADGGPPLSWPPRGLDIEARLSSGGGCARWARRSSLLVRSLVSQAIFRLGLRVGRFDPGEYLDQLALNSDYRKFDDGLRMTIDCSEDLASAIEMRLEDAERKGVVLYGTHRQGSALLTCYTPSAYRRDHVHFVDGADGGYAAAAARVKGVRETAAPPAR